MRAHDWTFHVVPGAAVVAEACRLAETEHVIGRGPCSRCWWDAGHYVKGMVDRWRKETAR